MPYFRWTGVDLYARTKRGKLAAYSQQELSDILFGYGIALLSCKTIYTPPFFWTISSLTKGQLFLRIAHLLKAGILLPDALTLSAQQSGNPILSDILCHSARDIKSGQAFSVVVRKYPLLWDSIVVALLIAGDESGNLMSSFEQASRYCLMQAEFSKKTRAALAMPLLTFTFFIAIAFFIFVFILPRFADMFSSMGQNLPSLTRHMIAISVFIRSGKILLLVGFVTTLVAVFWYYGNTSGKKVRDKLLMHTPFIGKLLYYRQFGNLFYVLSLLTNHGISLSDALKIIACSVDNSVIQKSVIDLRSDVQGGCLLSNAMSSSLLFVPEVIALVHVGQESGALGKSLTFAAEIYQDMLQQSLNRYIFFLQPLMIIILGLLVTALIFAIYLPMMELSRVI